MADMDKWFKNRKIYTSDRSFDHTAKIKQKANKTKTKTNKYIDKYKNIFPSAGKHMLKPGGKGMWGPGKSGIAYSSNTGSVKSSVKGNANITSPLARGGKLSDKFYTEKGTNDIVIEGKNFPRHFSLLSHTIDSALWMFVQAMGLHSQRVFQNSFVNKKFAGSSTSKAWTHLKQVTKNKRRAVGLMPGNPFGGILTATGRLFDSITFKENAVIKTVRIYTDPNKFRGMYPEYVTKDGKIKGRSGRVYAFFHNNRQRSNSGRHATPTRQFMGVGDFLASPTAMSLMDDYLYYFVFNQALGALSKNTKRAKEYSEGRRKLFVSQSELRQEARAKGLDYGNDPNFNFDVE